MLNHENSQHQKIERAFKKSFQRIVNLLQVKGTRTEDAEDFVALAFLRVIEGGFLQNVRNSEHYLTKAAINISISNHRVFEPEDQMWDINLPFDQNEYKNDQEDRDRLEMIFSALEEINPDHLDIILLWANGFKHPEISDMLGIPVGIVKSRKFRGLAAVKEILSED